MQLPDAPGRHVRSYSWRCAAKPPARRGSADATALVVGLASASSGQVSGKHSSSGHFRHDPLVGSLYDVLRGAGIVSAETARLVGARRGRPDQEGTSNERSSDGLVLGAREPPAPNWCRRLSREISRLQIDSLTLPTWSS